MDQNHELNSIECGPGGKCSVDRRLDLKLKLTTAIPHNLHQFSRKKPHFLLKTTKKVIYQKLSAKEICSGHDTIFLDSLLIQTYRSLDRFLVAQSSESKKRKENGSIYNYVSVANNITKIPIYPRIEFLAISTISLLDNRLILRPIRVTWVMSIVRSTITYPCGISSKCIHPRPRQQVQYSAKPLGDVQRLFKILKAYDINIAINKELRVFSVCLKSY